MNKKLLYLFLFLFTLWVGTSETRAQITVIDGNSIALTNILAQLTGQGVIISNVKVLLGGAVNNSPTGKAMYGLYTSTDALDVDGIGTGGLVIACGRVLDFGSSKGVVNSSGVFASSGMGIGGEPFISGSTFDACTLEFDIKPIGDEIYFNYCFASEEYNSYVCTAFNDVFKFMVTGPDPTQPAKPYNKTNIAIVPGTGIPNTANPGLEVAINSVNTSGPNCAGGAASFPQFHNANGSAYMVYNQRTKGLVARVNVTPCATYTFRLSIADRRDAIFDSGVFIQALNSNVPTMDITTNSVIKDGLEGCINPVVKITRSKTTGPETFRLVLGGSATFLVDYDIEYAGALVTTFPFNFTFPVGAATAEFKIKPKLDGLIEPTEIVKMDLYKPTCATGEGFLIASKNVNILDKDSYQILEGTVPNTIYRCTDADLVPKLKGVLADAYQWETVGGSFVCTDGTCREITPATQTTDATYKIKATFGDCVIERTITVDYAVLTVNTPDPICTGQSATLIADGRTNFTWSPATGLSCTNCATTSANPTATTVYTVLGTEGTLPGGCSSSKQVTVTVVTQPGPQFTGLNAQYCINDAPVTLTATPAGGTFQINGIAATTFNPTLLGGGQHTVKYVKNVGGTTCADFVNKVVIVNGLPPIAFTVATEVCKNGLPIAISATPSGGTFKIGANTITQIDPALYPIGNVNIVYSVTDINTGCLNISNTNVAILPVPTFVWQDVDDAYCLTDDITVTPKLNITDSDGSLTTATLTSFNPSIAGISGNVTLGYSFTGKNNCNSIVSKTITINTPPVVAFVGLLNEYCQQALPITLSGSPAGGVFTVDGVVATQLVPMNFVVGDVVTIGYTYSNNGCTVDIDKDVNIVEGTAYVPVSATLQVCPPTAQGYPIEALTITEMQAGYTYKWTSTVPALNGATTRVLYIKEDQTGKHTVLIRDAGNCPIGEKTFDITIKCNTAFFVPTGFTPNGDGKNDVLQIFGADFTKLRFMIINRWGEIIFTARNKTEGWDGNLKGKPAPAGIYTWKATYESVLQPGTVIQKEGSVHLIK